ncbi:MAG TPA: class I SAM-dependent methyltransferase [Gemmatimonadaceae bacterium]|nr:class I SAM-dependent methyltransferase [Gemmatimonadaceae bacterium]
MHDTSPAARRQRTWPPVVVALLLQVVAATMTVMAAYLLAPRGIVLSPIVAATLTGALAALLARAAALDWWWIVIQLLFVPTAVLASVVPIPRWLWLALFALLAAVYWSTFRTQVPLYLSSRRVRLALLPLLPEGRFCFMDVGSGVGGVLTDLSDARPDGEYHGIESAPFPWLVSWVRTVRRRPRNCHVHWGSLWNCDLSSYDVVFAYLSPVPMAALWEKVQHEMRPGSTFISNTFVTPEPPTRTVTVDDLHHSTLYVWTLGAQ